MNPSYTPAQADLMRKCKAVFTPMWESRASILTELLTTLQMPDPESVGTEPGRFLQPLSEWLTHLEVTPGDRGFLATRLGFFMGDLLSSEVKMDWFLVETTDSRYFAKYVLVDPAELIAADPISMAFQFAAQTPPRNLVKFYEDWKRGVMEIRAVVNNQVVLIEER